MTEETIFAAALEKCDPAERAAYLTQACGRDAALRRRVEALLRNHDKMGAFLKRPAAEQMSAAPARADVTRGEQPGDEGEIDLSFLQSSNKPGSLGRLAHYEVLEVIGRGGCGIVLKAFDEKLHRMVAIKVMAPHLAATSPARKRFLREARSAAAVRHENVISIYAVEDQPIPYLVMEYVAGETLEQKLDRTGPLEAPEVLRIGRQIAAGLAAAHALGLIHRDIKPSNVLLENGVEPRVKITDFGLARAADDASLTQSGVIAGTPLYMAPEQARGETTDARADLFSLGSVLYFTCSGRPPFRAANTLAVLKRVAEDEPRPIREIIPEVPKWLCAIIARLHAKQPHERFASARELADLLGRHLAQVQRSASMPSIPPVPAAALPSRSAHRTPAGSNARRPAPPAAGQGTAKKTAPPPAPAARRRLVRRRTLVAAGVFFLLLAGLGLSEATGVTNVRGTVIRLFSPEGTLVVEVDDPDVRVTIDGKDIVITGAGVQQIRLKPGSYKIEASKDGKLVRQELVTIVKNGRQVVRVSKEVEPVAEADKGGKPEGVPRSLDLKYIPADASAAVVVHPRRIVQSPLVAGALPHGAADEMSKELGVKPEQIEQAIVLSQVDAAMTSMSGAIIRFTEPVNGKKVLTGLLKGLREEKHEGTTYYRSSTGESLAGLPLAGALPDERTALIAPEPMLRKMLAADGAAKSPLLDRLRRTDTTNEVTAIFIVEPYRKLLKAMTEPLKALLSPDLTDAASLPDRLVAVTAAVNLNDKTLLKVSLEADSKESVEVLDKLAFQGLNLARKVYPTFRPTLLKQIPAEVAQPALAIVDQVFGGIQVTKEGKRLIVRLEKPESLGTAPQQELIASASFNDARGMNSNPVPGSPYPLDSEGKQGGSGEVGWAGPWSTRSSPHLLFQKKAVYEGDGALYLSNGSTARRLAEGLGGQFQVEMFVQVPAGGGFLCYLKNGSKPWAGDGPVWSASDGKFGVLGDDDKFRATAFVSKPGKWHKVTLCVDVPKNEWQFFVDDQKFETPRPLHFRRRQKSLDTIHFQCETKAGVYIDALRFTREGLVNPPPKDLIASSGFNDARGMNSNPVPGSPFPLNTPNRQGGVGEPGWKDPWIAHPRATFQSKIVFEGDGALYLQGSPNFGPNYGRQLTQAQTGKFQVEYHLQVPAGSSCGGYVWRDREGGWSASGPNWGAGGGKFTVHGKDTGVKCLPERWYKVTLRIDVPKQTWELFVDDRRFEAPKPLPFRTKVQYLDYINFLVEGGVYIDALRVTRLPGSPKAGPKTSSPTSSLLPSLVEGLGLLARSGPKAGPPTPSPGTASKPKASPLGPPPFSASGPKKSPKAEFKILSAEELTKAFLDDEAAARKKYGGLAPVAVQGVVKEVNVTKKGEPMLYLKGSTDRLGVACPFEAKDTKALTRLKVGQKVIVAGVGYGIVGRDVLLGFCRLVPVGGTPKPR